MQALKERRSLRHFDSQLLPLTVLSNLLWAALGINRGEQGKRTSPTSRNRQEIDIYIVMTDGVYKYDKKNHCLSPVLGVDIRVLTGKGMFVSNAPVNLVYVANTELFEKKKELDKVFYSAVDTGFVSQNVYLFCASEGLATCVYGDIDRASLAKALKLKPTQKIILGQSVGLLPKTEKPG